MCLVFSRTILMDGISHDETSIHRFQHCIEDCFLSYYASWDTLLSGVHSECPSRACSGTSRWWWTNLSNGACSNDALDVHKGWIKYGLNAVNCSVTLDVIQRFIREVSLKVTWPRRAWKPLILNDKKLKISVPILFQPLITASGNIRFPIERPSNVTKQAYMLPSDVIQRVL